MKYFADNLRFLRKKKGLSQEALAEKLSLKRGNIASYEKAIAEPKIENLLKIVKYFAVDLEELLEKDLAHSQAIKQELKEVGVEGLDNNKEASELMLSELIENQEKIEKFISHSDDMQKILDGFRKFHQFKMQSENEISEDAKKMADDYEKLLQIMESMLEKNKELTSMLKSDQN